MGEGWVLGQQLSQVGSMLSISWKVSLGMNTGNSFRTFSAVRLSAIFPHRLVGNMWSRSNLDVLYLSYDISTIFAKSEHFGDECPFRQTVHVFHARPDSQHSTAANGLVAAACWSSASSMPKVGNSPAALSLTVLYSQSVTSNATPSYLASILVGGSVFSSANLEPASLLLLHCASLYRKNVFCLSAQLVVQY